MLLKSCYRLLSGKPPSLNTYLQLFKKSSIVEEIIPSTVTDATIPTLGIDTMDCHGSKGAHISSLQDGLLIPIHDILRRDKKNMRPIFGLMTAEGIGINIQDY